MNVSKFLIILLTFTVLLVLGAFGQRNYEKYFGDKTDENNLVINLQRQKTPRHQLLIASDHGVPSDLLHKKKPPAPPRTNDSVALYRYLD